MENAELGRFKQILKTMLGNLEGALCRRDEIAIENAPDALDCVQRAADRELAICQIEARYSRMQNVLLALERIEGGSYGICLQCDQEISQKRLRAAPWASYCVLCQDMADRERMDPEREWSENPVRLRSIA